ncbi:MAG TPA: glycosyltransferase family 4 protein [Rhizomicrobium sp.]|jgi:glycosyltransferase involved in cell wall biosynthesis
MVNRTPVSRIALVGPIAEPGRPAVGGYESSNLRLLLVLRQIFADVQPLAYPQASGSAIRKSFLYARGFSRLLANLLFAPGRGAAVHFTPLCRHFLAAELLVAFIARLRGYRLTLDLRAGMQETWFCKSSPLYRYAFRRLLSLASAITYEGESYAGWLEILAPDTPRRLLPNFVPAGMLRRRADTALPSTPKLVYVGAVSEAKGVTAALRAFLILKRRFPGVTFVLVGRCEPDYRDVLLRENLIDDAVTLTGPLPLEDVQRELDQAHFFPFLTQWFGEGHSNAITEAMARGCVPIVSGHGFSKAVIACPELVIPDREDSGAIAARMAEIWLSGRWGEISDAMTRRVAENFTDLQTRDILRVVYHHDYQLPPNIPDRLQTGGVAEGL